MAVRHLAHASFRCSDLDRTLAFYCGLLGLRRKFSLRFDEFVQYQEEQAAAGGSPMSEYMREKVEEMRRFGAMDWVTYLEVADHEFIEIFSSEGYADVQTFDIRHFDHIGFLHIALEVDDIHATCEKLRAAGVPILREPGMGLERTWQCWVTDPDGNAVELMEYTEDSRQLKS